MYRRAIYSSEITSVGYDRSSQILELQFNTGEVYQYTMVPDYLYEGLINASSASDYFNSNIKGRFETFKV